MQTFFLQDWSIDFVSAWKLQTYTLSGTLQMAYQKADSSFARSNKRKESIFTGNTIYICLRLVSFRYEIINNNNKNSLDRGHSLFASSQFLILIIKKNILKKKLIKAWKTQSLGTLFIWMNSECSLPNHYTRTFVFIGPCINGCMYMNIAFPRE